MKIQVILLLFFLLNQTFCKAQKFTLLSDGNYADSSFYHIEKISENEFWICGEYGILKKTDTLGNLTSIAFNSEGKHLLKIKRWKHFVFVSTDNGSFYRYNLLTQQWMHKYFEAFENRCFYDFSITEEGTIITCGGTKAIAKGKKKIPHGFIAISDTGLSTMKSVWKSFRKFVFSVGEFHEGKYHAIVFNGIQSYILKSNKGLKWKRGKRMSGLVHSIKSFNGKLWVCGAKSIDYKKDGLVGKVYPKKETTFLPGTGCIWHLELFNETIIGICRNGSISLLNDSKLQWEPIIMPQPFSIYDLSVISKSKIILVGHGKRIYLAEF